MKLLKNNKTYFITIALSLFLILMIMLYKGLFPFGNNSLAYSDLVAQYELFFKELITKIDTGESLFISLSGGYGYSFFATILTYLMSPINLVLYVFKNHDINKILNLVILVKPLLASLTMTFFLKKKFNSDKVYISLLSILYAFSGFYNAYYFNIMWIDAMILLPIITLGLEHLVVTEKKDLYIISLFLAIITNYYQGYILCIYCLIYFIFYAKYKEKLNKETIIRFIKSSLLACLLSAFILLPLFFELKELGSINGLEVKNNYSFNLIEFITSFFTGGRTTRYSSVTRGATDIWTNVPNICCGAITFALFICYLFNPNIKKTNKKTYSGILVIFLICFFIPIFDFIFEGFHTPNDLPFRYSYIFSFILITISMYTVKYLDKSSMLKGLSITKIILLLILVFNPINTTRTIIMINLIVVLLYTIFYLLTFDKITKVLSYICIPMIVIFECLLGFTNDVKINEISEINKYKELENNVKYIKMIDKYPYYRIESKDTVANSGSLYNYSNVSIFSSVLNSNTLYLNNRLGLDTNSINYYEYRGATPVYNTLFDIKYLIGEPDEYFDEVIYKVYKNKYNKDLMFEVDKDILNWNYKDDDPIVVQNDLVYRLSKEKDLFTKISYNSVNKNYYEYEIDTDSKYVYIVLDNIEFVDNGDVLYYRDTLVNNKNNPLNKAKVLNVNTDKKQDIMSSRILKLDVSNNKKINIYYKDGYSTFNMYVMNEDKFIKFQDSITNSVSLVGAYSDEILGAIEVDKDDTFIFTSLEYKDGWKLYVDSKEVEKEKIGGSLIGFTLNKGLHSIYLKYEQPYYNEGIIISCITVIFVSLYKMMDVITENDKDEEE